MSNSVVTTPGIALQLLCFYHHLKTHGGHNNASVSAGSAWTENRGLNMWFSGDLKSFGLFFCFFLNTIKLLESVTKTKQVISSEGLKSWRMKPRSRCLLPNVADKS